MSKLENTVIENAKISSGPKVLKQIYLRELYSLGSLESHLKKNGVRDILQIWGNYKHFHVVVKY